MLTARRPAGKSGKVLAQGIWVGTEPSAVFTSYVTLGKLLTFSYSFSAALKEGYKCLSHRIDIQLNEVIYVRD